MSDYNFTKAASIESLCWEMRLADWPRAVNRAKINSLGNGVPPYTQEEAVQNNINFNYNNLNATKIFHDARRQMYNGLLAPDPLFTVDVDYGPVYRRRQWGSVITKEINKLVTKNLPFRECQRSVFASDVLHGIGPSYWIDKHCWKTKALGVEDVLIPSGTLLEMENLPFFAIYRQWTGMELKKMIEGPNVDSGWNFPLAKSAIKWVDEQAVRLMGNSWPEAWSPEKWEERTKEDSGLYSSDKVPTIDVFDFYFWQDDGKQSGWKRRIVLDAWGTPGAGGQGQFAQYMQKRRFEHGKDEFLYTSGKRNYADKRDKIIHWQFADCSCVAPFRYHSVRSLGFLLWAVCNIQNRLNCKFMESAFEDMMQYLRSTNPEDAERALAINLIDKRVLPSDISFIGKDQRWQITEGLINQAMQMNRQSMADNSVSFTQDFDFNDERKREETATRTIQKANSTAAMTAAMLGQAYDYERSKYEEICRRFCIKNSKDSDVRRFRVRVLAAGVPEEALAVERWSVTPQKVIGAGNKQLQVGMMQQVMSVYDRLNPEAQQDALRMWIAVNTDDYDLANRWVPEQPHISDSVHDAQQSVGTIMAGGQVAPKPGLNTIEVIEVWLHALAMVVTKVQQSGGVPSSVDQLQGMQNFAQHIGQRIQMLSMDKTQGQRVKMYSDDLKNLSNEIKAFGQRLQEKMQSHNGQAQQDPKDLAKAQAQLMLAQNKMELSKQSHAQKTAQKQIAFEQGLRQDALKTRAEIAHDAARTKADIAKQDIETAANVRRGGLKAFSE